MGRLRAEDAAARQKAGHGPDFLEALARGIAVLTAFTPERRRMSLADVSRAVDLPRATARRALVTLAALGYVEQEDRQFFLTPRVLRLAGAYLGSNPVSTVLQPACDRIAREVGESSSAAVLDGGEVVMVAHATPHRITTIGAGVGYRLPAFCSSLGRVLLAGLPEAERAAFLGGAVLTPLTPRTETDPARLRALVAAAAEDGHALVDQEAELGYRSIAVPVRRFDGAVVCALNVGAPVERMSAETLTSVVLPRLLAAASDLSAQIL